MLIIWGTKVNRDERGTVADQCPVCMKVRHFAVTDHYEVGHVYFISIGQGTRVATTRACLHCHNEFMCESDGYDDYLPTDVAVTMPVSEVVKRTNTKGAEARNALRQLEAIADEPAPPPSGETATGITTPGTGLREVSSADQDEDLRQAIERLKPYEGAGAEVTELMKKLATWRTVDAAARDGLLQEVNAYIAKQHRIDRSMDFIVTMAQRYPHNLGCFPALLVLAALGSAFLWAPIKWGPILAASYVAIGFVIAFIFFLYINYVLQKRWFRNVMIPEADAAGVDLQTLVVLMIGVARSKQPIQENIRGMCSDAGTLRREIVALGRWNMTLSDLKPEE